MALEEYDLIKMLNRIISREEDGMKKIILITLSLVLFPVYAERPHGPKPVEVHVNLGTPDGQLIFVPDNLTFERSKYYKLTITNPSPDDHYFTSDALSTHVFTRKVEVAGPDGKTVAEIHGGIYDIELKPGATVSWFFFPMTKGKNLKLYCHKNNHEQAGMVANISIVGDL